MNWFDKIILKKTNVDSSPELKRGEIKEILLSQLEIDFSDFQFRSYKNSCYTLQRIRKINEYNVYETFHIVFTLKDKNFACSVASRLNSTLIDTYSYNSGWINPHIDLIVLRKNTGIIPVNEAYYFHNGQLILPKK